MIQKDRATQFQNLHTQATPLILTNIWDAGSAKVIAEAGASAIATGSWSVAAAFGYKDGEALPFELALVNLERIVAAVDLPVSIDLESGYSVKPEGIVQSVTAVLEAGAVGINLEDQRIGTDSLFEIAEQVERIQAAREAANRFGIDLYINARTDIYLKADPGTHSEAHMTKAIERGHAYARAVAIGFFVPGFLDVTTIGQICESVSLPVNILRLGSTPSTEQLAAAGVKRISAGPGPYRTAMKTLLSG
ncbi:MAG: isocitrate lyase/phosphoenolpyruvate mutase family protein [Chloroflexota bacterium]